MLFIDQGESDAYGMEAPYILDLQILTALLEPLLNLALHVENLLLHARIPVVLNSVVCAALQILGNDCPLVLMKPVLDVQDKLLFKAPVILLNARIQMIMPSLAALLANATG